MKFYRLLPAVLALLLAPGLVLAQTQASATWRIQVFEQSDGGAYDQFAPFCETGTPCSPVLTQVCVDGIVNCQTTSGDPAVVAFTDLTFAEHTACITDISWLAVSGSSGAPLSSTNCVTRDFTGGETAPDQTTAIYVEVNVVEIVIAKAYTEPQAWDPEVEFTLNCSAGTVTTTDPSVQLNGEGAGSWGPPADNTKQTTGKEASFWLSGFDGNTRCFATETVPLGYVQSASTCGTDFASGFAVDENLADPACTITNRPTSGTFNVDKNFSDSNPNLAVAVTPLCTDVAGGPAITYSPANGNAQHGTNFVTTVKYFNGATNCTASEADPVGYTQNAGSSTCDEGVALTDGASPTCTIVNQQDPVDIYAEKIFTSGGGTATFAIDSCGGNATVQVDTNSASPGSPAHYIISNFPWNGATCNVTEPVAPAGYYEVASTCNGLSIVPSDADTTCAITNAPTRATFEVTKEFTDGDNPTEVEVTIDCFTGLPITQSQEIDENGGVTFVVESFDDGELDCDITEDLSGPELDGYTPTYHAGGTPGGTDDSDGCHFDDVPGGAENTCHIVNDADPVEVAIEKLWVIEGDGGDAVDQHYKLTLYCNAEIDGGKETCHSKGGYGENPVSSNGNYESCKQFEGYTSDTFTAWVTPEWPSSHCWVDEKVYDDSVEIQNDCSDLTISHGQGDSCLITNTVFFEGIPTLSQYGLAILALLMLGVGMVGFRRIV